MSNSNLQHVSIAAAKRCNILFICFDICEDISGGGNLLFDSLINNSLSPKCILIMWNTLAKTTPDCMTQLERIQSASSSSHCSHAPLLLVSGWLAGEGGVCRGVSRGPEPTRSVDIVRSTHGWISEAWRSAVRHAPTINHVARESRRHQLTLWWSGDQPWTANVALLMVTCRRTARWPLRHPALPDNYILYTHAFPHLCSHLLSLLLHIICEFAFSYSLIKPVRFPITHVLH